MVKSKVLVVEDIALLAMDLADRITSWGYEIIGPFPSGEATLKHIEDNNITLDAAILDIEIKGGYNGVTLANELNKRHSVPIIYLTKKEDENTLNQVLATGFVAYVNKPFRDNELKAALHKAIGDDFKFNTLEINNELTDRVFIQNGNGKFIIHLEEIIYLESHGECTKVYIDKKDESIIVNGNLGKVLEKLSSSKLFERTFRSYAVNVNRIIRINSSLSNAVGEKEKNKKYLILEGTDKPIDISDKYRSQLMGRLKLL